LEGAQAISQDILNEVGHQGSPFVSGNARGDPRVVGREAFVAYQFGTILCAPLKVSERVLGVLYADHSSPADSLSESTISLFAAFCNLAAIAIDNALAHQQLLREKTELEQYLHQAREEYAEIVGNSPLTEALRNRTKQAAASPLDILIVGESGTGKELVARAISRTGRRKSGKFVAVDCGSLSDTLFEAELFGYRKGAFTGAIESRTGLLESADGGIIFLDEIANLPLHLQAKLLRVLQEREVRRLGETTPRKIDIQVIAATNKDLLQEMKRGRFRDDLYYRLRAMEIRVPPLRERAEDIPLLLSWFLKKYAEKEGVRSKKFSPEAMQVLKRYSYPGNIRELMNIVSECHYCTGNPVIGLDQLPPEVRGEHVSELGSDQRVAERLYREIVEGRGIFEDLIKEPFFQHQLDRFVVLGVVERALRDSNGIYRDAFARLRIPPDRYSQNMQFLKRHECYVDYRRFRTNHPD
jgi:transcriptional regulator with GAF, ATPase, and Fis domain